MNGEMKVGLFVLAGAILFSTAIFLLGDYSFQRFYTINAEFSDVAGLPDKAAVKLSGVEVGKIKKIFLKKEKVIVELYIREGVKIYRNAHYLVGSTSVIGSKFLEIDQGTPGSGVVENGETVLGENSLPLDRAMTRMITDLQGLIKDVRGNGSLTRNINEIMTNLREATANLNELLADTQPHAQRVMERLDSITAKLDDMLTKTDAIVDKINRGEGTVGALVSDKQMKENVTSTLNNLKDASASVKTVVGRINGFKTYWRWNWEYEPAANASRSDFGIRIYPRDGRYYYVGAANIVNIKDRVRGTDYETRNTVDAQMGWELNGFDLYAGAISGSAGGGVRWQPFYYNSKWDKISLMFEASEFTRNRVIKRRFFNTPRYDAGVNVAFNKYISAAVRLNDLTEVKRLDYSTRIAFEDKDISYLLGFLSFGGSSKK
ncbi:MAG: MlaD family protein [Elusimicrobia bacterium]|nr:MlaD family protein [Elusimicrobiota bacterium]